jgi:hypothetical protein
MADKTVMDMFADMAKQINVPKIDYEAFLDIHRKNFEAMQKSAAVLSEGGRAVFAKQQEILAEVGREARQLIADFSLAVLLRKLRPSRRNWPSVYSKRRSGIPGISQNWSRNRAAKPPRSFLTGCARVLPKRGRPSSPGRPDT